MDVIDGFLGEHAVLYTVFEHLEKQIPLADSLAQLKALSGVLAVAVNTHSDLEDELLFNDLEAAMGAEAGPVRELHDEHEQVRVALAHLSHSGSIDQCRDLLRDAIEVSRDHFRKEDGEFFDLARERLRAPLLQERGVEWAKRRGLALS